jgi:integrase
MARPRRTKLKEDRLSDGSVVFWADVTVAVGDRRHITIGHSREGIDRATALSKLRHEELKIAAGQWVDPRPAEPTGAEITFQQYASEWFVAKGREVEKRTVDDLRWRLTKHLIPFFGAYQLAAIDKQLVKKFREFKLAERDALAERISAGERPRDERGQPLKPLSNTSINKLLGTTSAIFDEAVEEDELLDTNPVPRKRLKQPPPKRTWLMPDELLDLIEAAERVDQRHKPETIERAREVQAVLATGGALADAAKAVGRVYSTTKRLAAIDLEHRDPSPRRAIIAMLGLAGPRASECCALDLRDVDLANRRLAIRGTKTDAAERKAWIVDFLRDELLRYKHETGLLAPYGPLYPTSTGKRRTKDNLRQRVLPAVVREANRVRRERGAPPISEEITPHTLRRTFISLQLAYGRDVPFVQRQAGHRDPRLTLRIYTEVQDTDFGADILELLMAYSGEDERPAAARRGGHRDRPPARSVASVR